MEASNTMRQRPFGQRRPQQVLREQFHAPFEAVGQHLERERCARAYVSGNIVLGLLEGQAVQGRRSIREQAAQQVSGMRNSDMPRARRSSIARVRRSCRIDVGSTVSRSSRSDWSSATYVGALSAASSRHRGCLGGAARQYEHKDQGDGQENEPGFHFLFSSNEMHF